jgi:hypothetical protein
MKIDKVFNSIAELSLKSTKVYTTAARLVNKSAINAKASTASKITNLVTKGNIKTELFKSIYNELNNYDKSSEIFILFSINKNYIKDVEKLLLKTKFIIISDKSNELLLVCWLGSESWQNYHKDKSEKLTDEGLVKFKQVIEENPDLVKYQNWIYPKLTNNKDNNTKLLKTVIENMK